MSQAAAVKIVTVLALVRNDHIDGVTLAKLSGRSLKAISSALLSPFHHLLAILPGSPPCPQMSDWNEKILESLLQYISSSDDSLWKSQQRPPKATATSCFCSLLMC